MSLKVHSIVGILSNLRDEISSKFIFFPFFHFFHFCMGRGVRQKVTFHDEGGMGLG